MKCMGNSDENTVVRTDPWNCIPSADELGGKNCLVKIYPAAGAGGLIELPNASFVIGRDMTCDLDLGDKDVSRRHAVIEPTDEGFVISDLGSTNGTYVNGEAIGHKLLVAGDFIRVGGHIMKFLASDHIESQYHEAIYSMMICDGLTGARNRRHFLEILEKELARSRRHVRPLSLALIDLDHFKRVNDTFGHLVGDNVLREFAHRVSELVREDEVFARYGGEEFGVILDEATVEMAKRFAERVCRKVAEVPFTVGEEKLQITVSIGIGHTPGGERISVEEILQRADRNLYLAKHRGRNQVYTGE